MSWLFSQALVEASSEASSLDGKPCAQLNVMPTQRPFWRNDKMMEFSSLSRFGLTSKLLTDDHGEGLLTSFLADSRAKISASPVREGGLIQSDLDSGEKWHELSVKFDLITFLWKTHQLLFDEVLPESSVTLPKWGIMRDGVLLEQMTPERLTTGNESGYWPTPRTTGLDGGSNSRKAAKNRGMWPTPTASTGGPEPEGKTGRKLSTMVKMWPTPHGFSKDGKSNGPSGNELERAVNQSFATPNARDWKDSGPTQGNRKSPNLGTQVGGSLNPPWVEWLMGWPIGWTDLKPLETAKYQQWLDSHGEY